MTEDGAPDEETVAALLAPIEPKRPGGSDVSREDDYRLIAAARRDEKANLPRGIWVREVKHADWALVERLCTATLTRRSKDLRVACWLSEAWVHHHEFAGLAAAMTLLQGLCERYWDVLHPMPDGSDASARILAIDWLNEKLPLAIRQVPVVIHAANPEIRFSWADRLAAERLEALRSQNAAAAKRAEESGATALATIEACRDRTDMARLAATHDALTRALAALGALDDTLDARCGRDAPGLGRIRDAAGDIADFVADALAMRQTVLAPPPPPQPALIEQRSAASAPPPPAEAMTRESAYRQLAVLADALRRLEPHSPVPPVLDQIAGWGALTLAEIDAEMQYGGGGLIQLLEALGHGPQYPSDFDPSDGTQESS